MRERSSTRESQGKLKKRTHLYALMANIHFRNIFISMEDYSLDLTARWLGDTIGHNILLAVERCNCNAVTSQLLPASMLVVCVRGSRWDRWGPMLECRVQCIWWIHLSYRHTGCQALYLLQIIWWCRSHPGWCPDRDWAKGEEAQSGRCPERNKGMTLHLCHYYQVSLILHNLSDLKKELRCKWNFIPSLRCEW